MNQRDGLPWLTFDCYDTLVRYSEIKAARLAELVRGKGGSAEAAARAQTAFETLERELQTGPFKLLNVVLRESLAGAMDAAGLTCTADDEAAMIDAVRTAEPFDEAPAVLTDLKNDYRLAVLSNSEPDIIRHSIIRLGVGMDAIVLAADAKCYKPAAGMFEALLARIDTPADQVTHIAQSFYHDIRTAKDMGFGRRIWVNRYGRDGDREYAPDREIPDLSTLRAVLEGDT